MGDCDPKDEEREVLLSIYEGDDCFKQITATCFQYKYGIHDDVKSFILELRWGEKYPDEKPEFYLDAFYNKHIVQAIKDKIVSLLSEESEQYLGMSMTYSLFEFLKERFDDLISEQPAVDSQQEPSKKTDIASSEFMDDTKKVSAKKEQLTKAQKRKQWDRTDNTGEKPRGWNWVDIVKHLSQTGHAEPAASS